MSLAICGASLWSSLSKTRGVAFFWRHGVCVSRAEGHQAVTDPRVPPATPLPNDLMASSNLLVCLRAFVSTFGGFWTWSFHSFLLSQETYFQHSQSLQPPPTPLTSSLPGECSQAHRPAPSCLPLSMLMDANRRKKGVDSTLIEVNKQYVA